MEVSCAPCPLGPTSLPLSLSAPSSVTTTATITTIPAGKQENTKLYEVSPDSGNGDDLDEFDQVKSPIQISDTKCESKITTLEEAVGKQERESTSLSYSRGSPGRQSSPSSALDARPQGQAREQLCDTAKYEKHEPEMITYMTKKPELFRLNPKPENSARDGPEWQIGMQPELSGKGSRPTRGTYYSPAFNLRPLHSSLLVSCGQPFQCGPFSSPCRAIGNSKKSTEENGIFSLPEGGDDMLDASLFSKSYLLGDNGRACIKPFSLVSTEDTERFRKPVSNCCDTSYSLGVPHQIKIARNPEYPRCLRSRPARRYTNPEVVRKQPTSGGLQTTSCDLMTSPLGQCACVNPGTSHACVPRLSGKSSLGMLNPMFEADYSSKQETHTTVPSLPRKLSLDHESKSKCSGNEDIYTSHPSNSGIFSLHEEPVSTTQSLSRNSREPLRRASEASSGTSSQSHLLLSCTSAEDLTSKSAGSTKKASLPAKLESLSSIMQPQSKKLISKPKAFAPESVLRSLDSMSCAAPGDESTKTQARPPMVTSPEWINLLTPSQEAYTQSLFTPNNLHEELFYPAPYGLKSEVYQNLNAKEADFVLQKPNRKPRSEPLPSLCVSAPTPQRPESPDLQDGIIPPLATEDEEALKEGARESRKASLRERRKSSLDKIHIPNTGEVLDPIINVKIDNFDREEYVKYKKTLSETDSYILARLKFAARDKQISLDSDSSNNSDNRLIPSSQESLKLETMRAKKYHERQTNSALILSDDSPENIHEGKEVVHNNTLQKTKSNSRKKAFFQKDISYGRLRSYKQTLPRQRSLEENETTNKVNSQKAIRKQSLPTEELFGIRRNQHIKKFSLNQLMSPSAKVGASAGGVKFSPVNEDDEAKTPVATVKKKRSSDTSFPSENDEREYIKTNVKSPNTSSETRHHGSKPSRLDNDDAFIAIDGKSLSGDSSLSHYKATSSSGKRNKNIQRRRDKLNNSSHHQHNHYPHHHHTREGDHRRPHRTEHLRRRPRKSSFSPDDDKEEGKKLSAQRSLRRVPREQRGTTESHINLGALLSPPEQENGGDLFTNRRCSHQERQPGEVQPVVPYEPLVDDLTPTTPDDPPAASGATSQYVGGGLQQPQPGEIALVIQGSGIDWHTALTVSSLQAPGLESSMQGCHSRRQARLARGINCELVAREADRFGVSDRGAASIATSALVGAGLVSPENKNLVIDKSKLVILLYRDFGSWTLLQQRGEMCSPQM
ncbi:hypothetical protein GWK47_007017 [Chionoecetes opilio]|uniref:Uncharacterized protein n=1 Tax=Chionoecetes opilio TaxID=41210 RepID=A0A8J4YB33_CHIOP|nr:hypothetical protein GWK47_007017 [Chionoecetes opilio]